MDHRSSEDGPGRSTFTDWAAQDWADLMPRLLLFAGLQLARAGGGAPNMAEAEDLVHDAITKTMAGLRVWNPEVTLFQHLAGVIGSDISHSTNSAESRLTVRRPGRANGHTTWPPDDPDPRPTQEDTTASRSERQQLLAHLRSIDPVLAAMAELMLVHDLWETRELSDRLAITPAEVANLRKRLNRAVRAYLTEKRP